MRDEEGLFQKLCESILYMDLILFIGRLGIHDATETPSNSNDLLRDNGDRWRL